MNLWFILNWNDSKRTVNTYNYTIVVVPALPWPLFSKYFPYAGQAGQGKAGGLRLCFFTNRLHDYTIHPLYLQYHLYYFRYLNYHFTSHISPYTHTFLKDRLTTSTDSKRSLDRIALYSGTPSIVTSHRDWGNHAALAFHPNNFIPGAQCGCEISETAIDSGQNLWMSTID